MKTQNYYKTSFKSELPQIKNILGDISHFLDDTFPNMSVDNKTELKLIFSELLCNAVIHGNKNDNSKLVDVSIEINKDNISSTVRDQGVGFNYIDLLNSLGSSTVPNNDILKESGRGIWLVYSLSDTMSFNTKGNEIKFHKKVN